MSGSVLVVGTGLIGTSIGLALRGLREVLLADTSAGHLDAAARRGAGQPWDGVRPVDLIVLATPPDVVARAYDGVRDASPAAVVTHVASIQSRVLAALTAAGADPSRLCGGHPIAGRETAGPEAATADLFAGRPWVLCPSEGTSDETTRAVTALAVDCLADPVVLTAQEHDATMALVSHLPHLAASATAARLAAAGPGAATVSGPGLADTTRVAAGDPDLWAQILLGNASFVAPVVRALAADLDQVAQALEQGSRETVHDLLARGNAGRALVPVKRGGHDGDFTRVSVSVPDAPGQLAGVFACAAQADVNIEDVRVEHLPGRPSGLLELSVHVQERGRLHDALTAAGFTVLPQS